MLVDPSTSSSRGVGFVTFTSLEEASAAIAATDGVHPEGERRALQVKFAAPRKSSPRVGGKPSSPARTLTAPSSPSSASSHSSSLSPSSSSSSLSSLPPSAASSADPSLYIAGLPTNSTRDALHALLSPYGPLSSIRILPQTPERVNTAGGNSHRGVAFARFHRTEDAEKALERLSGWGRAEGNKGLTVRWATQNKDKVKDHAVPSPRAPVDAVPANGAWSAYQQQQQQAAAAAIPAFDYGAMLLGSGMYGAFSPMELMAAQQYAAYPNAPFLIDPTSAYQFYAQAQAAQAAAAAFMTPLPPSSQLSAAVPFSPSSPVVPLSPSSSSLPPPAGLTLFLCHLPPQLSDGALFALFSPFGALMQCRVVRERDGRSKGYGFVSFHTAEQCAAALQAMHGAVVEGRSIKVQWKADSKSPQQAALDHAHSGWWQAAAMELGQPVLV